MERMASSCALVPAFGHSRPRCTICMRLLWTKHRRSLHSSSPGCRFHSPLSALPHPPPPLKTEAPRPSNGAWKYLPTPRSSGPGHEEMEAAFLPFPLMPRTPITSPQHTSAVAALPDANRSCAETDTQTSALPVLGSSLARTKLRLLTQLHFSYIYFGNYFRHCHPVIMLAKFRYSGAYQATSSLRLVPLLLRVTRKMKNYSITIKAHQYFNLSL